MLTDLCTALHEISIEATVKQVIDNLPQISSLLIQMQFTEILIRFRRHKLTFLQTSQTRNLAPLVLFCKFIV